MKRWWKLFREAVKESRAQGRAERYFQVISSEPFTLDLVKKIAKDYGYSFRIVNVDGKVLEFPKIGQGGYAENPYTSEEEAIYGGR